MFYKGAANCISNLTSLQLGSALDSCHHWVLSTLKFLANLDNLISKTHLSKILPIVKNQYLLLCTLLIGNPFSNGAYITSSNLYKLRFGLTVVAAMAPLVRLLLWIFFPSSYPISKVTFFVEGQSNLFFLREQLTMGSEAAFNGDNSAQCFLIRFSSLGYR